MTGDIDMALECNIDAMAHWKLTLIVPILLLSGCVGNIQDQPESNLNVNLDSNHGLIEISYEDGEITSTSFPTIGFDFSNPSNNIVQFGVNPGDGRATTTLEPSTGNVIEIEYQNHGLYNATAFIINGDGTQENQTHQIQIDQRIEWYENNTGEPQSLTFDTNPGNEWPLPSHFFLNSTIENPSFVDPDGREVTVSWDIGNQEGICQTNNGEIENGELLEWRTIHFAPEGNHEIKLTIEDGQDRINVQHLVEIIYQTQS